MGGTYLRTSLTSGSSSPSADALTGHPRTALTALLLVPNPFRVVFAHPTQAKTDGTFWVDHETRRMGCWR